VNYDNWQSARKVCVIGAGTMGSGIAAHLSNIGFEVSLLDVTQQSVIDGFSRARSLRPPHFYTNDAAERVRLGSVQENLDWVSDADWVCEAIVEKLDLKRALFERIEPLLSPKAMISTNTSGLQIELLAEGRSESFQQRFIGTHFFNPPRHLKLLELIPTAKTDPAAVEAYRQFLENRAARRVVVAKDTPGFIANRFGMWAMFHAIHTAERLGLSLEQVDLICGPFLGRPRSGAFRLNDLVGLDIMQDIANNLIARCPNDPHMETLRTPRSMATLMERGHLGSKTGAGYYKKEGRELLAIDLGTLAYRQAQDVSIPSIAENSRRPLGERVAAALQARDEAGEFLRLHLLPVLQYANYLKEEISHSVLDFDRVMMWGFGWEQGPFAMMDAIGKDALGFEAGPFYQGNTQRNWSGVWTPLAPEPAYVRVTDFPITESGNGFNVRDLGDGVSAICLTTKMGTINPSLVADLTKVVESKRLEPFVLTTEGKHFSAGFDLQFFLDAINEQNWTAVDTALLELQNLTTALQNARGVAAIFGYCLGAGTEIAMACPQVAAHPETNFGLPEAKVGLLPGGGGTAMMALRSQKIGARACVDAAIAITQGFVSASADEARKFGLMRGTDVTVYHPDRLIYDAKQLAMKITVSPVEVWAPPQGPIGGMIDKAQDELKARGDFSAHDELIGDKIKYVFTKAGSYEDALRLERSGFLELCKAGLTVARIKHMLETGKPLRN
jgi:3-hydroxyacyl-CoA dehydrogenase